MSNINYVLEGKFRNQKLICTTRLKVITDDYPGGYSLIPSSISSYHIVNIFNNNQYFRNPFFSNSIVNKNNKEYLISVEWKDGGTSLILINDKYFKIFLDGMS